MKHDHMSATGIMQLDLQVSKLRMDVEALKRAEISTQQPTQSAPDTIGELAALVHRVAVIEAKLDDLKSLQASAAKKERSITEAVVLQKVDSLVTANVQTAIDKRLGPEFEAALADSIRSKMDAVISERIEIAAQRVMNNTEASCKAEISKLRHEFELRDCPTHTLLEETPALDGPLVAPSSELSDGDEIQTVPQQTTKRSRGKR